MAPAFAPAAFARMPAISAAFPTSPGSIVDGLLLILVLRLCLRLIQPHTDHISDGCLRRLVGCARNHSLAGSRCPFEGRQFHHVDASWCLLGIAELALRIRAIEYR